MNYQEGPDPKFPYLDQHQRFFFPDPLYAEGNIVAVGGNLSPGMLLSAYEQGIFPWYNPGDPVLWQSPDPRCLIFPHTLHISRSMQKILKQGKFTITINRDFDKIIRACSEMYRPGQGGTWISEDIIAGYCELNRLGYALSAESYLDGKLAGGCYGVLLGNVFCGESMFTKIPNAAKAAFLTLAQYLFFELKVRFIDCQVPTDHLISLGGVELGREEFLSLLREGR